MYPEAVKDIYVKEYRISDANTGVLELLEDQQLTSKVLSDFEVWFDLSFITTFWASFHRIPASRSSVYVEQTLAAAFSLSFLSIWTPPLRSGYCITFPAISSVVYFPQQKFPSSIPDSPWESSSLWIQRKKILSSSVPSKFAANQFPDSLTSPHLPHLLQGTRKMHL